MKKIVLLFTAVLMGLTSVTAAEKSSATFKKELDFTSRYRYTHPVTFVERGVEFLIFADGSFDFNAERIYPRRTGLNFQGQTRRGAINVSLNSPGRFDSHYGSRSAHVDFDRFGRIYRIANVFIDYDRFGRITQVGSVNIDYRHGYLRQVGGLKLQFNGNGRLIHTKGYVNRSNRNLNARLIDRNVDHRDFNDDDFYYYQRDGKVKKQKKLKSKKRY